MRGYFAYGFSIGDKMIKSRKQTLNLIKFSMPLILSGILQQLYSWADAFIVGRTEGELPLAAINATSVITNFLVMIITGFTLGLSILAAQKYGENDREYIKNILSSFTLSATAIFSLLCILGICLTANILSALNTPADIIDLSEQYLKIIFIGIPFLTIYNIYSSLLRAAGNSKAPFYSVLISSVINVILDIIFVAIMGMGVKGAAIATVISQLAMTIFIIAYGTIKYKFMRMSINKNSIKYNVIKQGIRFGFPPALQYAVTSGGSLILQNFMNGFGTHTVAAITTAYRIDSIMLLPIVNLGSAISTMVAQSKGAGKKENIKSYAFSGLALMIIISLIMSLIMAIFGSKLISMFGVEKEATQIGKLFFQYIACFYVFFGIATALRGAIEGLGNMLYSSLAGILALVIRIALSYILSGSLDNMSIAFAEGISWIFLFLLIIPKTIIDFKHLNIKRRK